MSSLGRIGQFSPGVVQRRKNFWRDAILDQSDRIEMAENTYVVPKAPCVLHYLFALGDLKKCNRLIGILGRRHSARYCNFLLLDIPLNFLRLPIYPRLGCHNCGIPRRLFGGVDGSMAVGA